MKTRLIFIFTLIIGFISTAQNSKFDSIEEAITFNTSFNLIDLNEISFSANVNKLTFNSFKYSQNLKKQVKRFNVDLSATETMIDGFLVFSPKLLKKNAFQDYNMT